MKNPRLLQTTKTMLATVALTGLMAGSAARVHASTTNGNNPSDLNAKGQLADDSNAGKHDCKGLNSCKGQGGCKTGDAGCKAKNTCKGKGGLQNQRTGLSRILSDEGLVLRPLVLDFHDHAREPFQ